MLDFFISSLPLVFMVLIAVAGWNVAKRVLGTMESADSLYSLPAGPYSRETPEEALQRAKRGRVRAEHDLWDSEFHALIGPGAGCSHCAGPARRSASRRVPFM
jgi:hypothetical protein